MEHSVLIVGSDRVGNLENSYSRAFQRLGWTINFWDSVAALHKVSRGYRLGRLFSTFVNVEPWLRKANLELLHVCEKLRPSLILVIGTEGVRGGTIAQIRVRMPETLIYCIYPDSPHLLTSDRIQCLPFFDRVATSSPLWMDAFIRFGAERVFYLPFASDTDIHFPVNGHKASALGHDLVFIGNWRAEREDFLEQLADFDLCLWGTDYWARNVRPSSKLKARWGGRPIFGSEFSQVCSSSKILLNIMDSSTWPGPNMRTFELPACRAFSLVTRTPSVIELFKEGETIECFDSVEEAQDKIRFYLDNESARQRLAEASYQFVVHGGHTYIDRAKQILEWASEDRPAES